MWKGLVQCARLPRVRGGRVEGRGRKGEETRLWRKAEGTCHELKNEGSV